MWADFKSLDNFPALLVLRLQNCQLPLTIFTQNKDVRPTLDRIYQINDIVKGNGRIAMKDPDQWETNVNARLYTNLNWYPW